MSLRKAVHSSIPNGRTVTIGMVDCTLLFGNIHVVEQLVAALESVGTPIEGVYMTRTIASPMRSVAIPVPLGKADGYGLNADLIDWDFA